MAESYSYEPGTGMEEAPYSSGRRDWTFMIYMAGDNSLDPFGRPDLLEMKQVGSTPRVAVVAQFDDLQERSARRYYLRRGTSLEEDRVPSELDEINTGDPRELVYFMAWAMNAYPAERYALVLWNHGSGWKEDDIYRVMGASAVRGVPPTGATPSLVAQMAGAQGRSTLFARTLQSIVARGIAYDDTSRDFLDNAELKRALDCALLVGGVEKLDLVGFDACLMSMLEVAYQLKDETSYLVGSQETEPGEGWPYQQVLRRLIDHPEMGGGELAGAIVAEYVAAYDPAANITQSALDLGQMGDLIRALNDLCTYVMDHQATCELALGWASRRAQQYADPDYKDLHDLCRLIRERSDSPQLDLLAQTVMNLIAPSGPGRFVRAQAHCGTKLGHSHGVSIYFPAHAVSPFYRRLDFASETLWDDLLLLLTASR